MKPLVLGTTSPYKKGLFERLGLPFESASPDFEETVDESIAPSLLSRQLSEGKAFSLQKAYPGHIIVSADQVLALGSKVFTKPGSVEAAIEQLQQLSGHVHALHTAFTLLDSDTNRKRTQVVSSYLTVHENLDPNFLKEMIIADETHHCVGGYKIESRGSLIMRQIDSPDHTAIIGLPLIALSHVLHAWGYLGDRFRN